ncbi:PA domain-containing protein [Micromonospora peucetia]|uniref:PA domain-containing protein n=1 Tax=Micromonospora peucetia TaxID=47871 RepID=UPI00331CFE3B
MVKQAGFVNTTDAPITLALTLTATGENGAAAPADMFTLGATSVTVPAGARAEVPVTFNVGVSAPRGDYTAVITATAGNGTTVQVTVGATKTMPTHKLTVNLIGRDGAPAAPNSEIDVFDLDTGSYFNAFTVHDGIATLAVPSGRYSVMAFIDTLDAGGYHLSDETMGGSPEMAITGDVTVTIDARQGQEVRFETPEESEPIGYKLGYMRQASNGLAIINIQGKGTQIWDHVYVIPTAPVTVGYFEPIISERRYAPVIRASFDAREDRDDRDGRHGRPGASIPLEPVVNALRLDGHRKLTAVAIGAGRPEDVAGRRDIAGKLAVITRDRDLKYADQIATAASAGAAAAVIVNDMPGAFLAVLPGPISLTGTAIPAYTLNQDDGRTLLDRIAAGRTVINLHGVAVSPFVYNAVYATPGQILASPVVKVTRDNSAIFDTVYHGAKGTLVGDTQPWYRWYTNISANIVNWFPAQTRRQEWYSTGNVGLPLRDVTWMQKAFVVSTNIFYNYTDSLRVYNPGDRGTETWLGAGSGPASPGAAYATRDGDTLTLNIQDFSDSGEGHVGFLGARGDSVSTKVYRNGQQIAQGTRILSNSPIATTPEEAIYRVTLDTKQAYWSPLATSVSTAWTFKSARTDSRQALSLLWPRYDFGTDRANTVRGDRTHHFGLDLVSQAGANIGNMRGVEISVSDDDGATWRPATIKAKQDGYTVKVTNPDTGFVSLRIKAWDANGNQVDQTLIRAYAVR